jgi:hypothetical protein
MFGDSRTALFVPDAHRTSLHGAPGSTRLRSQARAGGGTGRSRRADVNTSAYRSVSGLAPSRSSWFNNSRDQPRTSSRIVRRTTSSERASQRFLPRVVRPPRSPCRESLSDTLFDNLFERTLITHRQTCHTNIQPRMARPSVRQATGRPPNASLNDPRASDRPCVGCRRDASLAGR